MAQQRKRTSAKSQGTTRRKGATKRSGASKQSRSNASRKRATAGKSRGSRSTASRSQARSRGAASRSRAGGARRTSTRDALGLLRADHVRVKSMLRDLQQATTEARRTSLIEQIDAALREHTTIEERIFYPAFREAAKTDKDRKLFHEATEEHHIVDIVLPEVRDARREAEVFAARAKVLRELVLHHIEEEQEEMFPRARQLFSDEELRDLGTQMAERKRTGQQPSGALEKVGAMIGLTQ